MSSVRAKIGSIVATGVAFGVLGARIIRVIICDG